MSVLRDMLNTADFKSASFDLHRSLKTHQGQLSLQTLQHYIAKALGAKSLEAYYELAGNMEASKRDPSNLPEPSIESDQRALYWRQAKENWYVMTYVFSTPNGDVQLAAHGQYYDIRCEGGEINFSPDSGLSTKEEISSRKKSKITPLYYVPLADDIIVVKKETALLWEVNSPLIKNLPVGAVMGSAKAIPLYDYNPAIFDVLMADADKLEQLMNTVSWSVVTALGFDQEYHAAEQEEGNTRLCYAEWVMHQLEPWRNDLKVVRDASVATWRNVF